MSLPIGGKQRFLFNTMGPRQNWPPLLRRLVICCPVGTSLELRSLDVPGPDNKSFECCCRNSRPTVINPLNTLELRHKGRNGVSHHQPHDCLLDRRRWKKTCKLRVTDLCVGNSPVTSEFPTQTASNAKNVSTWWRHHERRQAASLCQLCASSVVWVTSYKTSAEILQNLTQSQVKTIKTASVYLKKNT